jgi:hypothetical protein
MVAAQAGNQIGQEETMRRRFVLTDRQPGSIFSGYFIAI